MIHHLRRTLCRALLGAALCLPAVARAQSTNLQAAVTAGYEFSSGERLTLQKLNLLGIPTVTISGTVPGTTIATNSIGKDHLLTNVFDQLYLSGGDGDTATLIDQSIIGTKIATNSVGGTNITDATLTQDDIHTNTYVWVFTNAANATPATNDLVLLADTSASSNVVSATLNQLLGPWFTSAEQRWTNGVDRTLTLAHSLGRVPWRVRWVAVCETNEFEWTAGQELDLSHAYQFTHPQTVWNDATSCYIAIHNGYVDVERPIPSGDVTVSLQSTGGTGTWSLKCYAW